MSWINFITKPQDLATRIAEEAIALLAFGGTASIPETTQYERCIYLVGKAWQAPAAVTEAVVGRLIAARAAVEKDNDGDKLERKMSGGPALDTPDGVGIVSFLRDLFETAVRLDSYEERTVILQMADLMADSLDLKEWIVDANCGADGEEPPMMRGDIG